VVSTIIILFFLFAYSPASPDASQGGRELEIGLLSVVIKTIVG